MDKTSAQSQVELEKYAHYKHDKLKAFIDVLANRNHDDDADGTASVALSHVYPNKSPSAFSYTMPGAKQELRAPLPDLKEAQILASMTKYGDSVSSLTIKGPWFKLVQDVEPPWVCSIKAHYYPPSINGSVISHERKASDFLAMANGCDLEINWESIKHSSWSGNTFANGDPIVVQAWLRHEGAINFNFSIELLVGVSTIKGRLKTELKKTVVQDAHFTFEPSINPIPDMD